MALETNEIQGRDAEGRFGSGKRLPNAGRPKGVPNKTSLEIRNAICEAFDELGGITALVAWGRQNPNLFYGTLWAKLVPSNVKLEAEATDFVSILNRAKSRVTAKSNESERGESNGR